MSADAPFDPATLPLHGTRLVEASAGTGKTFSLAGLYLRLIVERRLDVREILVMTFTRAATQELRERLRERLAHAARVAAAPPRPETADTPTAVAEAAIAAAGEERATVARRLADAATRADQATITTIHGFAHRAAGENAFESALPFDRGEQVDDRDVQREAAVDYWRGQVFGRTATEARAFLQLWDSPEALFADIRAVLARPHARLVAPDAGALARDHEQARRQWPAQRDAFVALLTRARDEAAARANKALAGVLADPGPEGLAARIDAGLAGTAAGFPALPAILAALADEDALLAVAKNRPVASWFRPHELACVPLLARLQSAGRLAAAAEAIAAVRARSARLKRERRLYSFQDMIDGLHAAVTAPESGDELAAALRRTWPWALVDEFQDTDPLQYAILRRIYRDAGADGGLILIGDPKQAIYGFRGGDVFAYLDAAADADGRYRMATNFRSAPAVLDGLDALFRHGGADAFVLPGIDWQGVAPGRAAGDRRLLTDGAAADGVTAWGVPADTGPAKKAALPALRAATVRHIATLLDPARTQLRQADGDRPLRRRDIAVLVNTNQEAAEMQAALNAAGVPAVCVQQDSVFAGDAARDLLRLLRAAAVPFDRDRLRVALTTPLFGYRLGDIAALDADEARWSALADDFQQGHLRWARSGVQAMAEPFLQAAAARVAGRVDGERRLTDYLHVVERLQAAEHEVFGLDGLVRWLETALRDAADGEVTESDRLRLENDSDLVQVTTVHKAKGLQFPVVFVPYAPWLGTGGEPGQPPHHYHDGRRRAVIDLGSADADAHRPAALRERRAEAVRQLYVALTRAEQACFFAWGALNGAADGPLAWLLHRDDGAAATEWHGSRTTPDWLDADTAAARLEAAAAASGGGLRVAPLPEGAVPPPRATGDATPLAPARADFPTPRPPWLVFSFSGLAGRLTAAAEPAAGADDPVAGDVDSADGEPEVPLRPRGPAFGRAFHELLEATDFAGWPAPGAPLPDARAADVHRALRRHGLAADDDAGAAGSTATLVSATLHTALPGLGPLAALPATSRRPEIEFFLRLGGSGGRALMAAVEAAGYGAGPGLDAATLRGLMQGFIDLVAERDGRYWVIDYKTNVLGPRRRDYAPAALAEAVRHHHYDLQYLIYSVALHRHLRARLPGYDPARHLGGVQYLFVRGLRPGDTETGIHRDHPPAALIERLDALFDGGEATA